jgi:hypothetical protein
MTGVPDNCVGGRVEYTMNRECELDDTEVGAKVSTRARDFPNQELPNLNGKLSQLPFVELVEVTRTLN